MSAGKGIADIGENVLISKDGEFGLSDNWRFGSFGLQAGHVVRGRRKRRMLQLVPDMNNAVVVSMRLMAIV
jgi:hypothetical protein